MATLTFASGEQALEEGGSHVIFCRLVTRQETTCLTRGIWDHICPRDFAAAPGVPWLTPSTWTSSLRAHHRVPSLGDAPGCLCRIKHLLPRFAVPTSEPGRSPGQQPHKREGRAGHSGSRYGPIRQGTGNQHAVHLFPSKKSIPPSRGSQLCPMPVTAAAPAPG